MDQLIHTFAEGKPIKHTSLDTLSLV